VKNGSEPISPESISAAVYLTFDDGPDVEWTPRILDVLAAARVRATFFVVGQAVRAAPSLLRRVAAEGHGVGNHSYAHRHPWTLREAEARREVRDGAVAIADVLGAPPRLFRPPHGRVRSCMVEEAAEGGQRTVLWSLSAVDWGPLGRGPRIAARLRRAASGDVVLMHDGRRSRNRPDALLTVLPEFLTSLARRPVGTAVLA
jgi:peptidoglycan/xylan/chitin deacetylase (PgdA/CDA1 family)